MLFPICSILFRRYQRNPRLKEKRVEECVGRERECVRMHAEERVREETLWLLLLYVFSSTWACPMQIGLSVNPMPYHSVFPSTDHGSRVAEIIRKDIVL